MKKSLGLCLLMLAEVFLFPLLLIHGEGEAAAEGAGGGTPFWAEAHSPEETLPAVTEEGYDSATVIAVELDGQVVDMTLSDYLWGVVAAEMPASFEPEALKAQAVAARTETLYRQAHPSGNHPEAVICTDHTCCQAYISRESALERWGDSAQANAEKITQAVTGTDGMVVAYEGEVIQALFHSSSAGTTLSAAEVWGKEVPYLVEVASPEGEEVPNYYSVVTVTAEDFRTALLAAYPQAELSGEPEDWQLELQYNENGTLTDVVIGGVTVKATQMRTLFGLRSARFTIGVEGDTISFYVTGYGHGVGMSQYGANQMAREGCGFADILIWYYTGTTVETLTVEKDGGSML